MSCDCPDEYCEHWQAREQRFRARTDKLTALPRVVYCRKCFQRYSDCDCGSTVDWTAP